MIEENSYIRWLRIKEGLTAEHRENWANGINKSYRTDNDTITINKSKTNS